MLETLLANQTRDDSYLTCENRELLSPSQIKKRRLLFLLLKEQWALKLRSIFKIWKNKCKEAQTSKICLARMCGSSNKKLLLEVSKSSSTPTQHRPEGLKSGKTRDLFIPHLRAKKRSGCPLVVQDPKISVYFFCLCLKTCPIWLPPPDSSSSSLNSRPIQCFLYSQSPLSILWRPKGWFDVVRTQRPPTLLVGTQNWIRKLEHLVHSALQSTDFKYSLTFLLLVRVSAVAEPRSPVIIMIQIWY